MTDSKANTWVDQYGDSLFGYALGRVSDRTVAEDLVQETLLSALKSRGSFQNKSSEKTWLFGILKHKILDHYRKSHSGINKDLERTEDIDQYFTEKGHWRKPLDGWSQTPEGVMENKDFLTVLKDCVGHLPESQRIVFVSREVDALEADEICKKLSITSTNLWVLLHRARTKLRECLGVNWFGSTEKAGG